MGVSDDNAAFDEIVADLTVARQVDRKIFAWSVALVLSGLATFVSATLSLALLTGRGQFEVAVPRLMYFATLLGVVLVVISTRYLVHNAFRRIELMMDKYSIEPRR